MDNFLSGRENLGDQPKKAKDSPQSPMQDIQRLDADELPESCTVAESEGEAGSRVSYVTEEGRVTKIVVTCVCGQVTEIDCSYQG